MKVTLIAAMTADGRIARHDRHFPDWPVGGDKALFREVSDAAKIVVMGRKTYETTGPLMGRSVVVLTSRRDLRFSNNEIAWNRSPGELVQRMKELDFQDLVVAGGAQVYTSFVEADLVDEFILTVSPVVFGEGPSLLSRPVDTDSDMKLEHCSSNGSGLVVLKYRVRRWS
jgi:dihydrofolate reductase